MSARLHAICVAIPLVMLALPVRGVRAADWYTGAAPQRPSDESIVVIDASTDVSTQGSYFGDINATVAPVGTLSESGVRVRADALGGTYSYYAANLNETVHGTQESAAALVGYEWLGRNISFAAYLGGDARNNTLSVTDPSNAVVGTSFGGAGVLELFATPTARTFVSAHLGYETNNTAYFARLRAGYLVGPDLYVGPELLALGDAFFNQERVGAHISGLHIGNLQFSFSAGYLYDRVRKAGGYTSVDARVAF